VQGNQDENKYRSSSLSKTQISYRLFDLKKLLRFIVSCVSRSRYKWCALDRSSNKQKAFCLSLLKRLYGVIFCCKRDVGVVLQAVGQDLVENEAILEAVNQEALQLLEEIKNGDGLVDMNGFEAQLRLVNEKWNEAKVQVLIFVVKFI